jgi:hypothetical protein
MKKRMVSSKSITPDAFTSPTQKGFFSREGWGRTGGVFTPLGICQDEPVDCFSPLDLLPTNLEEIFPLKNPIINLGEDFDHVFVPSVGSHKEGSSISNSSLSGRDTYLLTPRSTPQFSTSWGLDNVSTKDPWPSKARRKSTLKHAQENVSPEVSQGRQRLISGVLKVGVSPSSPHS